MYKEHLLVPQTPEFTLRVLLYEIGSISKIMIYMELFGPSGYLGDLRAECADALTMISLLAEQLGFEDLDELANEGLERFEERQREKLDLQITELRR